MILTDFIEEKSQKYIWGQKCGKHKLKREYMLLETAYLTSIQLTDY